MQINGVSHQERGAFQSRACTKLEEHPTKGSAAVELPTGITPEPEAAEGQEQGEQKRGVLRLLEEGHFKGVADVRLRINFFDELAAQADSQAVASVPGQTQSLTDQVAGEFASVLGTLGLDEQNTAAANQLMEAFRTAAQEAAGAAVTDGRPDTAALQAKLGEAFTTLVNGLRSLTAPPEPLPETTPETPDGGETGESQPPPPDASAPATPADPTEPPPADTTAVDPFASLTQVFDAAVATLNQSLSAMIRLPDPAPSPGHGAAYDKFLAIYNAMRDGDSTSSNEQTPPDLELSA
jgi:hypothetical protein